jgi:hypothetical protein
MKKKTLTYKVTKLIHDRLGIFINPITIRPTFIYSSIKARYKRILGGK